MQDLKHLSRNKHSVGHTFFGFARKNKRLNTASDHSAFRSPPPNGKRKQQLTLALIFLLIVLTIAPLSVLVLRKASVSMRAIATWFNSHTTGNTRQAEAARPPSPSGSFELAGSLLQDAVYSDGRITARTTENSLLDYTIHGDLQQRVHGFLQQNQVPYGVFVALEPSTGRILAMTAYSSADPAWSRAAFYDLYPMASLFKIITASAALEARKITPATVIEFRGNSYSENPRYWSASPRGKNNRMDVTYAMGKSINPVYGRLACDVAGKKDLMDCVDRFGFNQNLLSGTPAKASQAADPGSNHELMLMGAGLNHEVKVSPLHAATIISAIANNGRMMSPGLTEKITDKNGAEVERFVPKELRRLVSQETATSLAHMLSSTVLTGTSRKAFHDRRGRPLVDVPIAAKTGSINGENPKGHYSWFAAYAPIQNPRIALVALVINPDKWKVKASQVGEQALSEFFSH